MKKKICLLTWYRSLNYGTCLQAFSLYKFLEGYGYDVFIPDNYRPFLLKHPFFILLKVSRFIKKILLPLKLKNKIPVNIISAYKERERKNNDFIREYIDIKNGYNKSYKSLNLESDIFITGSDQIWNPTHLSLQYLLNFTNKTKINISYASSIGVNNIPFYLKRIYKKYLKRFKQISVREKNAAILLERLLKKTVNVVLDPTFLLEKNYWNTIVSKHNCDFIKSNQKDQFIFCYFIGKNQNWLNQVRVLSEKENLPIYIALSESYIVPDVGTIIPNAGIQDFLWMLNNSKYICTDSFHAIALAINMEKPFFAFKRFQTFDKNSQNSRIENLLEGFSLRDRIIENETNIIKISKSIIDYDIINSKLNLMRKVSINFLINSLND